MIPDQSLGLREGPKLLSPAEPSVWSLCQGECQPGREGQSTGICSETFLRAQAALWGSDLAAPQVVRCV